MEIFGIGIGLWILAAVIVFATARSLGGEGDRMVTHLTGYAFGSGPMARTPED